MPPPGANICVAAPAIRLAVDILMVTSMTLVYLDCHEQYAKLGCKYVMQLPTESVLQCKRQFAGSGQISEFHIFAPPPMPPAHSAARCRSPLLPLTIVTSRVKTGVSIIPPGGKFWLAKAYPSQSKITLSQQVFPCEHLHRSETLINVNHH